MARKQLPKALVFDVFGTCVDWHGTIIRDGRVLNKERGWDIDWEGLVNAWRAAYKPSMDQVRTGAVPWTSLDNLHLASLKELLPRFIGATPKRAIKADDLEYISKAWHRLKGWPDTVRGLKQLKSKFIIGTLSNGNVGLLTRMAKHAGMPWDVIFSSDWVNHYKPDPEMYLSPVNMLNLKAEEVMLVAAHKSDLDGAAKCGLQTAFIIRPLEYGKPHFDAGKYDSKFEKRFDYNAKNFTELADKLGC
ncbi:MAG TPA: haloacid dehalogenase type II [Burkholderiales bacterium]|nr:haloacid dehalogenase type II [Burkholderiales bacterium]